MLNTKKQNQFFIEKQKNVKLNNQNKNAILKNVIVKYYQNNHGEYCKSILINKDVIETINKAIYDYMLLDSKSYIIFDKLLKTLNEKSNNKLKKLYANTLLDNIVNGKIYDKKEKLYIIDIKLKLSNFIQSIYNKIIIDNQNNQ